MYTSSYIWRCFILKNINSNNSEPVRQIDELEIPGRVNVSMLSSKSN